MNLTLVLATLRQRFTSPLRLLIVFFVGWIPMLPILVVPDAGFNLIPDCYFLVLALAAGLIGQDLASGTVQLVLARPVTRAQLVFSRWIAVAIATIGVVLLQVATAALIMAARGAGVPWRQAALFLADNALLALGTAAVMALLSALAPGLGDLGLLVLANLSAALLQGVGAWRRWGAVVRAAEEVQHVLKPELHLGPLAYGSPPWPDVVSYLSTVTLCLALAVVVLNRRELSYASTGG